MAHGGRCLGSIHLADVLRPEAIVAVRRLREMGLRTVLLTGDRKAVANAAGKSLGADDVAGELC